MRCRYHTTWATSRMSSRYRAKSAIEMLADLKAQVVLMSKQIELIETKLLAETIALKTELGGRCAASWMEGGGR